MSYTPAPTVNTGGEMGQILDHLACASDPKIRRQDARDALGLHEALRAELAAAREERAQSVGAHLAIAAEVLSLGLLPRADIGTPDAVRMVCDAYRLAIVERDAALARAVAAEARLAEVADEAEENRRTAEAAVKFLGRIGEVTWDAGLPSGDREQTLKNVRALASRLAEARDAAEAYLVGGNSRPLARWFAEVPS